MAQQSAPPQAPGYDPNTMGGMQATGGGSGESMFLKNTAGLVQDVKGFHDGRLQMFGKSPDSGGWKDRLMEQLGIRTKAVVEWIKGPTAQDAPVDTSSDAGNATYEQIYGCGEKIMMHGSDIGLHSHSDDFTPAATPGIGRSQEIGI